MWKIKLCKNLFAYYIIYKIINNFLNIYIFLLEYDIISKANKIKKKICPSVNRSLTKWRFHRRRVVQRECTFQPSYQPLSDPRGSEHVTLCNRIHA